MIENNILAIRQRVSAACTRSNRPVSDVVVVAVAKGRPSEEIKEALDYGITDIGENKVQEAKEQYAALQAVGCRLQALRWHMVGHLQTNKVKEAVRIFDLIHSVDSVRLAEEIDKEASKSNKIQDILIQVNASGEASKFGFALHDTIGALKAISEFKSVRIKGLMTIAPEVDDPEKTRPYFQALRELNENANSIFNTQHAIQILSMGMTDDFEVGIEEGANMVRIGRAIFEGR